MPPAVLRPREPSLPLYAVPGVQLYVLPVPVAFSQPLPPPTSPALRFCCGLFLGCPSSDAHLMFPSILLSSLSSASAHIQTDRFLHFFSPILLSRLGSSREPDCLIPEALLRLLLMPSCSSPSCYTLLRLFYAFYPPLYPATLARCLPRNSLLLILHFYPLFLCTLDLASSLVCLFPLSALPPPSFCCAKANIYLRIPSHH